MFYDIPGYEGLYGISKDGKVVNAKTKKLLTGNINSYGYRVFALTKEGKKKDCKLHRLLALTFIPNPNNYDCINHKDGNKLNNSLDNLEWCTKGYNNFHARNSLNINFDKKPVYQTTMDGKFIALWGCIKIAANYVGVTAPCITNCCEGRAESAGGFLWSYANTDEISLLNVNGSKRKRRINESKIEILNLIVKW